MEALLTYIVDFCLWFSYVIERAMKISLSWICFLASSQSLLLDYFITLPRSS